MCNTAISNLFVPFPRVCLSDPFTSEIAVLVTDGRLYVCQASPLQSLEGGEILAIYAPKGRWDRRGFYSILLYPSIV
jgi:hypothetical protein